MGWGGHDSVGSDACCRSATGIFRGTGGSDHSSATLLGRRHGRREIFGGRREGKKKKRKGKKRRAFVPFKFCAIAVHFIHCPSLPLGWNGILLSRLFAQIAHHLPHSATFPSHTSSHASIGSRSRARSPRQCQCAEGNHQATEHMSASFVTPCIIRRGPPRIDIRCVT